MRSEIFNPSAVSSTQSPPGKSAYQHAPHETRLLKILVEGYNDKIAAVDLGSSSAIGTPRQSIYRQLQVHARSEAVAKGLQGRRL